MPFLFVRRVPVTQGKTVKFELRSPEAGSETRLVELDRTFPSTENPVVYRVKVAGYFVVVVAVVVGVAVVVVNDVVVVGVSYGGGGGGGVVLAAALVVRACVDATLGRGLINFRYFLYSSRTHHCRLLGAPVTARAHSCRRNVTFHTYFVITY